ncbi:MAG: mycothiol synthase, partial [Cellulomonas sp.]|nr:mycothiol synthase [Cellulomonas sp.]
MTPSPPVAQRGPLPPTAAGGVRDLAGPGGAVDGVAPLSEQPLLRLAADGDGDGDTVHLLVTDAGDPEALAGYA